MRIRSIPVGMFLLLMLLSCGGGRDGVTALKFSLIPGDNSDWYRGAVPRCHINILHTSADSPANHPCPGR